MVKEERLEKSYGHLESPLCFKKNLKKNYAWCVHIKFALKRGVDSWVEGK